MTPLSNIIEKTVEGLNMDAQEPKAPHSNENRAPEGAAKCYSTDCMVAEIPAPPTTASDEELFARWSSGETRPGQELFQRYFHRILRFFRRQLGHSNETHDLVQNTFLGCVRARGRFRQEAKFSTFLFQIARYQLYKEFRRRSRSPAIDFGVTSLQDLGPTPSRIIDESDTLALLIQALGMIPINQQIAIQLYYLEEMTAPQVGEVLGIQIPAVRSRLRRGLVSLRTEISPGRSEGAPALATLAEWESRLAVTQSS